MSWHNRCPLKLRPYSPLIFFGWKLSPTWWTLAVTPVQAQCLVQRRSVEVSVVQAHAGPRQTTGGRSLYVCSGVHVVRRGERCRVVQGGLTNPVCNYLVRGYDPYMPLFRRVEIPLFPAPIPFWRGTAWIIAAWLVCTGTRPCA